LKAARDNSGQASVELLLVLPFVLFVLLAIVQVCMTSIGEELSVYTAYMGARARTAGPSHDGDNVDKMVGKLDDALTWAGAARVEQTGTGGVRVTAAAPPVVRSLSAGFPLRAEATLLPRPPLERPGGWSGRPGDNDLF
jgi:hypothetical protein